MDRRFLVALAALAALLALLSGCQTNPPPHEPALPATPEPTVATQRWSDPMSWPHGRVPRAGEDVVIPSGTALLLDVSPPPLGGLTIDGALVFGEADLELTAAWILVRGKLEIGSAQRPFTHRATLTLTGPDEDTHMGGRFLVAMQGGVIQFYGEPRLSWTRLAATAEAGTREILLEHAPDWRSGDEIVLASSDFDLEQAEVARVARVEGRRVVLEDPLEHRHFGELQHIAGRVLDERAEVGLLTRSIVVQGAADAEASGFGGHTMIMHGGRALIHYTEFYRMGQRGRLARYPVHWHMMGDEAAGSVVVGSSIHHSFNRCVTVHGSNGVLVKDNVAYDAAGHCYFLEDGAEVGNVFEGNLGLGTRAPPEGSAILPSDIGYPGPATFWITNPDNTFRNNVAAGSQGSGFWFALPEHPTGPSAARHPEMWPRFTPLREFSGNVAHSNRVDGLHVDRGPKADPAAGLESVYYRPSQDPSAVDAYGRNGSSPVTAVFERFTAYKNRGRGVWLRGEAHLLKGAVLADNAIGATFASTDSEARASFFVGESANLGTPRAWEPTGEGGRSLPRPWNPSFAIRGFEFYDGQVGVVESLFARFTGNALRRAAALSHLDFTAFAVDPENYAEALSFESNTQRVHFATRPTPQDPEAGEDGYRSAVFVDRDGSVSGVAGMRITAPNPFLARSSCTFRDDWNAYLCPERYAALTLQNADPAPKEIGPVTLTRSDGPTHLMLGTPKSGPNTSFRSAVVLGERYRYALAGPLPQHLRLHLQRVPAQGSVVVALPYAASTVYLYRDWWIDPRNALAPAASLAELVSSTGERYWLEDGVLYLKLQPRPGEAGRDWATLDVCRLELCR